jgi:hypothetical protein
MHTSTQWQSAGGLASVALRSRTSAGEALLVCMLSQMHRSLTSQSANQHLMRCVMQAALAEQTRSQKYTWLSKWITTVWLVTCQSCSCNTDAALLDSSTNWLQHQQQRKHQRFWWHDSNT